MTEGKTHAPHGATDKLIIGWSELIDFVEWGISELEVKVDTGARTSALHVEDLEFLPNKRVRFDVVLSRRKQERRKRVTAAITRWAKVRSSTGHFTNRCFVRTRIRLGPVEKEVEISLVSRETMLYRMLLGREALAHDFIVDVSRRRLHGDRKRKPKRKSAP